MTLESPRLAELLGSLSLATDAAAGLPRETAIRTSLVAVRIARAYGMQGFELADVYYAGLLRFLGCSAYSHEMAARYAAGDDLGLLTALTLADPERPSTVLRSALRGISKRASGAARAAAFTRLATNPKAGAEMMLSHCELAVVLARQLGMSEGVVQTLGQMYERWDGKGAPGGLAREHLRPSSRILHIGFRIAAHYALEGLSAVHRMVRERIGREFDPDIARLVIEDDADEFCADLNRASVWTQFLAAEPEPVLRVRPERVTDVARVFGHFADVKSPWTAGHSAGVAELATRAAKAMGFGDEEIRDLEIGALLHDVGRVAVPNGVWDKRGPLDDMEREMARAHATRTMEIVGRSPLFERFRQLAASDHERLDGSGYPRALTGIAIGRAERVLAAADVARALLDERPHRRAHQPIEAARELRAESAARRLDADAVEAVLAALNGGAPHEVPSERAVLTERELDVLRLIARGLVNKQIAAELRIAQPTVKRHIENLYAKTGVRSRAAMTVWALERGYSMRAE